MTLIDDMRNGADTKAYYDLVKKWVDEGFDEVLEPKVLAAVLLDIGNSCIEVGKDIEFALSDKCDEETRDWCFDIQRKPSERRSSRKVARFEYESIHGDGQ